MIDKALTLNRAKFLRGHQTDAEQKLWYHLRAHHFLGLKFKRQKPIGPYIVDFVCMENALVVEVDGGRHSERQRHDAIRDAYLREKGFCVLRFWNDEVLGSTEGVLEQIRLAAFEKSPSPPAPLPQAGEGSTAEV